MIKWVNEIVREIKEQEEGKAFRSGVSGVTGEEFEKWLYEEVDYDVCVLLNNKEK